jgi:hypothetical protein
VDGEMTVGMLGNDVSEGATAIDPELVFSDD